MFLLHKYFRREDKLKYAVSYEEPMVILWRRYGDSDVYPLAELKLLLAYLKVLEEG